MERRKERKMDNVDCKILRIFMKKKKNKNEREKRDREREEEEGKKIYQIYQIIFFSIFSSILSINLNLVVLSLERRRREV